MADEVWRHGAAWYAAKRKAHPVMWDAVHRFIKEFDITSVLEIGGGDGALSEHVPGRYVNIERNSRVIEQGKKLHPHAEFVHGDWMDVEAHDWHPTDLLVGCAVVEHCENFEEFMDQVIRLLPKFALISFFRGLKRKLFSVRHMGGYYENAYTEQQVRSHLLEYRLPSFAIEVCAGTNTLLAVDVDGNTEDFGARVYEIVKLAQKAHSSR